jgi:hypothetical protein
VKKQKSLGKTKVFFIATLRFEKENAPLYEIRNLIYFPRLFKTLYN